MTGFPTQAMARDAADQIAWQLAATCHDVFYPTTEHRAGEGWFALVHNGRQGTAFNGLLFGPQDTEKYLAALARGEGVLVPHG